MKTTHLFILNPVAGIHSCVDKLREEISGLDFGSDEVIVKVTEYKGHTTEIAKTFSRENEEKASEDDGVTLRIYSCGGDGTLNDVINGVAGCVHCAVCPVPVGSGNDFIKVFDDIKAEDFLCLEKCIRGKIIPVDGMKVKDRYSINIISTGLDAVTGKRQGTFKKLPLVSGPFAYKIALGTAFLTSMKNKTSFVVDGEKLDIGSDYITLAVIGNGRWYGGGFKAAPHADINDGLIDLVALKSVSRVTFLKKVGIFQKGEHNEDNLPFMTYRRCRRIEIIAPKPVPVQFDGEVFNLENPVIEMVPSAFKIILPIEE